MIKEQYKKTFHFIGKDMRWIVLGTVVIFIALIVLTDLFFMKHTDMMTQLLQEIQFWRRTANCSLETSSDPASGIPGNAQRYRPGRNDIGAAAVP